MVEDYDHHALTLAVDEEVTIGPIRYRQEVLDVGVAAIEHRRRVALEERELAEILIVGVALSSTEKEKGFSQTA